MIWFMYGRFVCVFDSWELFDGVFIGLCALFIVFRSFVSGLCTF